MAVKQIWSPLCFCVTFYLSLSLSLSLPLSLSLSLVLSAALSFVSSVYTLLQPSVVVFMVTCRLSRTNNRRQRETTPSVQQLLSTERAMSTQLRAKVSVRSPNLMLASHASDWLLAPLGLALGSDCFRTAVKFRLGCASL